MQHISLENIYYARSEMVGVVVDDELASTPCVDIVSTYSTMEKSLHVF